VKQQKTQWEKQPWFRFEVSRQTWRRWVLEGYAPEGVQLGPATLRWRETDLQKFEQEHSSARFSAHKLPPNIGSASVAVKG